MKALITGAAGFIGSHLAERLLASGWQVTGVDNFDDYYEGWRKRSNTATLRSHPQCTLVETDLAIADLRTLLADVDVVFHQAGQPGVRGSWADGFDHYVLSNIQVTQRLLDACRDLPGLRRFVYASSSSVYGNAERYPTHETDTPHPTSPYGVTKLAAEHLCCLYAENFGLPTVSLRYFTVYGPRQRPDMAIHRLLDAGLGRSRFPLFGTGDAVRDFTFVGDVVEANVLAATADLEPGSVLNVSGGSSVSMRDLIEMVGDLVGGPVPIDHRPSVSGDVDRTGGSSDRARSLLGWEPTVPLSAGLALQAAWQERVPKLVGTAG